MRQLPYTPGKDGAGVVEALGDEVSNLQVGQRVYVSAAGSGTYASHANLDVAGVYPLPAPRSGSEKPLKRHGDAGKEAKRVDRSSQDAASFAEGACVGVPCATALYALKYRGQAHAGCKVFVHGASGAVGLAAVQLARPGAGGQRCGAEEGHGLLRGWERGHASGLGGREAQRCGPRGVPPCLGTKGFRRGR